MPDYEAQWKPLNTTVEANICSLPYLHCWATVYQREEKHTSGLVPLHKPGSCLSRLLCV